ncbi:MAG: hypothetical protein WCY62_07435 [Clostridia bacterium]
MDTGNTNYRVINLIRNSGIEKDKGIYEGLRKFFEEDPDSHAFAPYLKNIYERHNGKTYTFSDHLKGLIYAQLSSQTKWINIEPHLDVIDALFFQYDRKKILSQPASYFTDAILNLKCGNINTKQQMESLPYNIGVFEQIGREYGNIDLYLNRYKAEEIAMELSEGRYKMKYIGYVLAFEYLRNVGVDAVIPDGSKRRMLGAERLGYSRSPVASDKDVVSAVALLSRSNNDAMLAQIDALLSYFCSAGYGKICTAEPDCDVCPIRKYCNRK